jgi:MoaA/NifB/PqqE/SkfB family radical SAM enzyme
VPESEFSCLVENLEHVKRLKIKLGSKKPEIRIMNPICSINYKEIPDMVEFAERHGASAVYFGHLQTTPLTSYLLLSPSQIKGVNRLVRGVMKTGLSNNFRHYLDVLNFKGTLKGSHTKEIFNRVGCLMPFYETQVHLDGEVAPCCLHPTIFNSKGMGFGELWNSEEYKGFRAKVLGLYRKKEKPFMCRGCRMCVYQEDIQRFYNSLGGLAKFLNEPR